MVKWIVLEAWTLCRWVICEKMSASMVYYPNLPNTIQPHWHFPHLLTLIPGLLVSPWYKSPKNNEVSLTCYNPLLRNEDKAKTKTLHSLGWINHKELQPQKLCMVRLLKSAKLLCKNCACQAISLMPAPPSSWGKIKSELDYLDHSLLTTGVVSLSMLQMNVSLVSLVLLHFLTRGKAPVP